MPSDHLALPVCPACRISLMYPAGHFWECERCGMVRIAHETDDYATLP